MIANIVKHWFPRSKDESANHLTLHCEEFFCLFSDAMKHQSSSSVILAVTERFILFHRIKWKTRDVCPGFLFFFLIFKYIFHERVYAHIMLQLYFFPFPCSYFRDFCMKEWLYKEVFYKIDYFPPQNKTKQKVLLKATLS